MGLNTETDETAVLQIGPTDQGMVRLYVASETLDLPMDFDPDEAREIAQELLAAADAAEASASGRGKKAGGKQKAKQGR